MSSKLTKVSDKDEAADAFINLKLKRLRFGGEKGKRLNCLFKRGINSDTTLKRVPEGLGSRSHNRNTGNCQPVLLAEENA